MNGLRSMRWRPVWKMVFVSRPRVWILERLVKKFDRA